MRCILAFDSIFIDFQKAFDAFETGIRGIVKDWCDSGLTDRVQLTLVGPVLSIKISSSCGVHPC